MNKENSYESYDSSIDKENQSGQLEGYKFVLVGNESRNDVFYCLSMIPYPSGAGMHLGHIVNYTAMDVIARYKRMKGFKVLNPICRDSFGLPTENYAMKIGKSASKATEENIKNFKEQALSMNWSYDWDREFATSSPEYYKWTQRIFSQLFKEGLAYRKESYLNRCSSCQTVLANDQVVEGKCERCDTPIIQKKTPQWFIKITEYADRLIKDLDDLDWPEETKKAQINWIGKREGMNITFKAGEKSLDIFSENPELLFGVAAIKICPEHQILDTLVSQDNKEQLEKIRTEVSKKTNTQRGFSSKDNKEQTFFLDMYANNPINGNQVPIIISESILPDSDVSAELVIPSLRSRDEALAREYTFDWVNVLDDKTVINSGIFSGLSIDEGREKAKQYLIENQLGEEKITYKLRDWSVSRQRYWGAPIPIYYDKEGNPKLVDDAELPVELPLDVEDYKLTGKSPLAMHKTFPIYRKGEEILTRESDTLDTFVDSSFYYLRFLDPKNTESILDKNIAKIVDNVDLYIGGKEHTVGHLIYSRFIHKFLYDLGYVNTTEPFKKLFHQGMIIAEDGRKMSKRWGNVVNPMDIIKEYSPDVLKLYILFIGPLEDTKSWNSAGLKGIVNLFKKIEKLSVNIVTNDTNGESQKKENDIVNSTIIGITNDIENFKFNVAISKFMILVNFFIKNEGITRKSYDKLLILLSAFAPDTAQKLWQESGHVSDINKETRPIASRDAVEISDVTIPIQVNGKIKGKILIKQGLSEDELIQKLTREGILKNICGDKEIKRIVFIQNKIINFVV